MQCSVYVEIKINPFINICQRRYYLVPTTLPPLQPLPWRLVCGYLYKTIYCPGPLRLFTKGSYYYMAAVSLLKKPNWAVIQTSSMLFNQQTSISSRYNVAKHYKALPMLVRSDGSEKSCLHFELRNVILFLKWRNEGNAKTGGQWIIMK